MPETECETNIKLWREKEAWHNAVALGAYSLWQREERPEGIRSDGQTWAEHFWLRAEAELRENGFG
jgi:hypothetical protein